MLDSFAPLIPAIFLSPSGLSYYYLYRRLEPDRTARLMRALRRYLASLMLAFSAWAIVQTTLGILLEIQSPILPMIVATFLVVLFNRYVLRIPKDWRSRPPYLSEDRSYHALLQVVAERAAEVKQQPEKQAAYLTRMYANDRARLAAVGQFLDEHSAVEWIALKPHQLRYHPDWFRLPYTTIFVIALLPIVLPFVLSFYAPEITDANIDLTLVASALASIFYSPLFNDQLLPIIALLALGCTIAYLLGREIAQLRFAVPGVFGLCALAFFLCFVTSYVQSYVVDRVDTPLIRMMDFLLQESAGYSRRLNQAKEVQDFLQGFGFEAVDMLDDAEDVLTFIREFLLKLQSRAGGLFILPALLFWGGLTAAAIWEINFSPAAQVTFKGRMRKPQV